MQPKKSLFAVDFGVRLSNGNAITLTVNDELYRLMINDFLRPKLDDIDTEHVVLTGRHYVRFERLVISHSELN